MTCPKLLKIKNMHFSYKFSLTVISFYLFDKNHVINHVICSHVVSSIQIVIGIAWNGYLPWKSMEN